MHAQPEVQQTIAILKDCYNDENNRKQWDFIATQYLSGNDKTDLRKWIIEAITGEKKPASQCSTFAVSTALQNSFNQISLF